MYTAWLHLYEVSKVKFIQIEEWWVPVAEGGWGKDSLCDECRVLVIRDWVGGEWGESGDLLPNNVQVVDSIVLYAWKLLGGWILCNFLIFFLFLAVLGLHFCARAFSSCSKRGPLFIAVRGPLTVVASLVAEHRLQMRKLSSCGSRAHLPCGMWDHPRPGLKPVSPALAGRFSTTAPPGKPSYVFFFCHKKKRKGRVAILMSDKVVFRENNVAREWQRDQFIKRI